jgi:hypothetical protein
VGPMRRRVCVPRHSLDDPVKEAHGRRASQESVRLLSRDSGEVRQNQGPCSQLRSHTTENGASRGSRVLAQVGA